MDELKAFDIVLAEEGFCTGVVKYRKSCYDKSEVDALIDKITEGAISMFRCSETCRGLDLKSPLGKIANIAFKHWNSVEFIQEKNSQLQKDKERLRQNNHHLLDEIKRLKEKMERRERHHKYKRCLAMVEFCNSAAISFSNFSEIDRLKYSFPSGSFRMFKRKYAHFDRWRDKWGKLADKFKDGKNDV